VSDRLPGSTKLCTAEYMLSTTQGVGPRRSWLPRIVGEAFLKATKDGEMKIAPDPVTTIDGDLAWYNNTRDPQQVFVLVHTAPRDIVCQSPSTVVIHDGWTYRVGVSPTADFPSSFQNSSVSAENLLYGRLFLFGDDSQTYVNVGVVPADQSMHFRYRCAVQTPGTWVKPSEFDARWEANARWCRLIAFASPAVE
jgi:hypothetical protein